MSSPLPPWTPDHTAHCRPLPTADRQSSNSWVLELLLFFSHSNDSDHLASFGSPFTHCSLSLSRTSSSRLDALALVPAMLRPRLASHHAKHLSDPLRSPTESSSSGSSVRTTHDPLRLMLRMRAPRPDATGVSSPQSALRNPFHSTFSPTRAFVVASGRLGVARLGSLQSRTSPEYLLLSRALRRHICRLVRSSLSLSYCQRIASSSYRRSSRCPDSHKHTRLVPTIPKLQVGHAADVTSVRAAPAKEEKLHPRRLRA